MYTLAVNITFSQSSWLSEVLLLRAAAHNDLCILEVRCFVALLKKERQNDGLRIGRRGSEVESSHRGTSGLVSCGFQKLALSG